MFMNVNCKQYSRIYEREKQAFNYSTSGVGMCCGITGKWRKILASHLYDICEFKDKLASSNAQLFKLRTYGQKWLAVNAVPQFEVCMLFVNRTLAASGIYESRTVVRNILRETLPVFSCHESGVWIVARMILACNDESQSPFMNVSQVKR